MLTAGPLAMRRNLSKNSCYVFKKGRLQFHHRSKQVLFQNQHEQVVLQ